MLLKKTQEMVAQERELQTSVESLRKEMALMREQGAQEHQQQGALGEVKDSLQNETTLLPGALKEEEAMKEKDELIREAQVEVAQQRMLQSIEVKVRELLKTELALL